ncbi:acyltransferase family protein [Ruania halotolerans]|uniref:acyltransferase family protein n=1 Tax=Ruania halotolerans TaxID=2897773 RepID=UPI001E4F015D|nr:acyltransferase family protein [Ruania halotolerans]UFU07568.1 acyltransferase [Ruania halotolerans]
MADPASTTWRAAPSGRHSGSVVGSAASTFRPDIEGLRALAIGVVLVYHAGVRSVPGGFIGVDVFFVLSGFLITGLLIRELERDGRISLSRFYARRTRRLLPATAVVLVFTALLTWWSASAVDWQTFGWDIVAAALYVVNWALAARSVDYLAEDVGVSPVQHFWSLAVEEQFYVVWPLLLVLVAWWIRRRAQENLRLWAGAAIGLVIVVSFAASLLITASSPQAAFFVTPTRLWELGLGAVVAIGATHWPRVPSAIAVVLGWGGFAAVVSSALVLDSGVEWPGYAALWPTLGTVAIIVSGYVATAGSVARFLSFPIFVWIGALSYSLYLWHWPLLVAAADMWGELGQKRGLLVVAIAFIPAYLSYRFIENPIRRSQILARSDRLSLSLGGNFTLAGVIAGLVLVIALPSSTGSTSQNDAAGASEIGRDTQPQPGSIESLSEIEWYVPTAVDAVADVPAAYPKDCQQSAEGTDVITCELGDPDSETQIAVAGDSKILQWWSALEAIAEDRGWHVVVMTKSSCGLHSGMQVREGSAYLECAEWNENVMAEILGDEPDAVLVSSRATTALEDATDPSTATSDEMIRSLAGAWGDLENAGIPVIVLLDNPSPTLGEPVYECVLQHPSALDECAFSLASGVESSAAPEQVAAADRVAGVDVIDLTDWICPTNMCVPVIGNVLVYRQGSHLTDTYVRTLTEVLQDDLESSLESVSGR